MCDMTIKSSNASCFDAHSLAWSRQPPPRHTVELRLSSEEHSTITNNSPYDSHGPIIWPV